MTDPDVIPGEMLNVYVVNRLGTPDLFLATHTEAGWSVDSEVRQAQYVEGESVCYEPAPGSQA